MSPFEKAVNSLRFCNDLTRIEAEAILKGTGIAQPEEWDT